MRRLPPTPSNWYSARSRRTATGRAYTPSPGSSGCTTESAVTRLIDTYSHLDFPDFDVDCAALLQRNHTLRVERQVVLSVYRGNQQRAWDLAQAEDGLYVAPGLYPAYLAQHHPQHLNDLRQWL